MQKRWAAFIFFIVLFSASSFNALAVKKEGKTVLLAVSENPAGMEGALAELRLELIKGNGRVFLETYPLTKTDTQISMRFAKQIACNTFNLDCDDYDFIFTIMAPTGIIGGPSAGASAAALIVSLFKDLPTKQDVAVTGTINSGALIGGVGGLDKKIEAADASNIKKILIPKGKRLLKNNENETDLVELGKKEGIEVIEVATLHEALTELTGVAFKDKPDEIHINKEYITIMSGIADGLCKRSAQLRESYTKKGAVVGANLKDIPENANKLLEKAAKLIEEEQYYSAASFCFRANVDYGFLNFEAGKLSEENTRLKVNQIKEGINRLNAELEKKHTVTITELQTTIIIKERVGEADDYLEEAGLKTNTTERNYMLSLANERLHSAIAWSRFFMVDGKKFDIDKESLRESCEDKIREAEERLQYTRLYIPIELAGVKKEIERAYDNKAGEDYGQCLFRASKAKAEANIIINLLGTDEETAKAILDQKLEIAGAAIAGSQSKNVFPILGYSYYEYAKSLKNESVNSALLFTEYVLELSHFDMYFKEKKLQLSWEAAIVAIPVATALLILVSAIIIKKLRKK